jgi:hypothetical protein
MHTVKQWQHPDSYFGATWEGWYSAGFGQSRDSDALEASNFQVAYAELSKLSTDVDGDSSVQIIREGHWAVGWVEWIAIHSSNITALERARKLCERANDYPVLDEEDWSRREDEECERTWHEGFNASDRVDYLRRHSYTATSLSDLLQAVRGGSWYHAANMLHSPSDVLC